jgi:hypothetical protein
MDPFDWRRFAPPALPPPLPPELMPQQGPPLAMAQMNQTPPGGVPSISTFHGIPQAQPIGSPGASPILPPAVMPNNKPSVGPGVATPAVTGTETTPIRPGTEFAPQPNTHVLAVPGAPAGSPAGTPAPDGWMEKLKKLSASPGFGKMVGAMGGGTAAPDGGPITKAPTGNRQQENRPSIGAAQQMIDKLMAESPSLIPKKRPKRHGDRYNWEQLGGGS